MSLHGCSVSHLNPALPLLGWPWTNPFELGFPSHWEGSDTKSSFTGGSEDERWDYNLSEVLGRGLAHTTLGLKWEVPFFLVGWIVPGFKSLPWLFAFHLVHPFPVPTSASQDTSVPLSPMSCSILPEFPNTSLLHMQSQNPKKSQHFTSELCFNCPSKQEPDCWWAKVLRTERFWVFGKWLQWGSLGDERTSERTL
jgi:hypothetical protein